MSIEVQKNNLTHTLCFLLSGKAGVGKSYVSDVAISIFQDLGLKYYKAPFAKGVKNTAMFMGWDGKKDIRGRTLLQGLGKLGRSYDEGIWVKSTFTDIQESVGYPYDVVVIDDWRFPNEFDMIKSCEYLYKPITVRINAPKREILLGTDAYYDESETALDGFNFDYEIDNTVDGPDYVRLSMSTIVASSIFKNSLNYK